MYSMCELGFRCVLRPEDAWSSGRFSDKVDSVGRPQPGSDMRVVDGNGSEVAPDGSTPGEILVAAPGIATSYWSNPQERLLTFVDDEVRSGELATIDEEGFLRIVDRKKDVIVSGGINIAPLEVEGALAAQPGVRAAAVIGMPPPCGEKPSTRWWFANPAWTRGPMSSWRGPAGDWRRSRSHGRSSSSKLCHLNVTGKVLRRALRVERSDRGSRNG
jgi:acyl-CoA synthetase (AMP-forming)/AMP-acid ligase II